MKTLACLLLLALSPLLAGRFLSPQPTWVSRSQDDQGERTEASARFQAGGIRHWRSCMVKR